MSEKVNAYFAMLKSLSSEDLDRSARELAVREKREIARLIAHIAEIGDRRYHLDLRLEEILDQALEIALEKKDPQRKLERRRNREAKKERPNPRPGDAEHEGKATPSREEPRRDESGSPAPSRHIPSEVRERVLERAGYQCEFCGPDGSRCSSRTGLEVEHTRPFAVYHSQDERYLRIYCPAHNLHAARKYYGEDFIRGKIEAARRGLSIGSTA
jgi:5-methylcytosine-specific restriction endonuclease McrA